MIVTNNHYYMNYNKAVQMQFSEHEYAQLSYLAVKLYLFPAI